MEVRVEDVDDTLPEGSYISVRIGDVQKQTLYDPQKKYRFSEARRFGKVDVYRHIGTCDLSWGADEPETRTCKAIGANGDTGIRLRVSMCRPANAAQKELEINGDKSKKAVKAKELSAAAKKYLQENNVEGILTGAMRALLKSTPADAPGFLCDYIRRHYAEQEQSKPAERYAEQEPPKPAENYAEREPPKPAENYAKQEPPTPAEHNAEQEPPKPAEVVPALARPTVNFKEYHGKHILPSSGKAFFSDLHLRFRPPPTFDNEEDTMRYQARRTIEAIVSSKLGANVPTMSGHGRGAQKAADAGTQKSPADVNFAELQAKVRKQMEEALDNGLLEQLLVERSSKFQGPGVAERPRAIQAKPWRSLPSVGTWTGPPKLKPLKASCLGPTQASNASPQAAKTEQLQRAPETKASDASPQAAKAEQLKSAPETKALPVLPSWRKLPSVASWHGLRRPTLKIPTRVPEPIPQLATVPQRKWNLRPSVGSWYIRNSFRVA